MSQPGHRNPSPAAAMLRMASVVNDTLLAATTLFALARLHDVAGEREQAIECYRRGLEIQPGNAQAQRRLRELTGGA